MCLYVSFVYSVCMCILCVHAYSCTCIYVYLCVYILCIYVYLCVYVHLCRYVYTYLCVYSCVCLRVCMSMCIHVYFCVCRCVCVYYMCESMGDGLLSANPSPSGSLAILCLSSSFCTCISACVAGMPERQALCSLPYPPACYQPTPGHLSSSGCHFLHVLLRSRRHGLSVRRYLRTSLRLWSVRSRGYGPRWCTVSLSIFRARHSAG